MKKGVLCIFMICALFALMGCEHKETIGEKEKRIKAENEAALQTKQGAEKIKFSMDRYLLNERNQRFNDPHKLNYLYVFVMNGPVLEFTIQGKLASTSKRLTNPHKIEYDRGIGHWKSQAADMMGTYGSSGGGAKVGMTTAGSLFEFGGMGAAFFYSEVPLTFSNLPVAKVDVKISDDERKALLKELNKLMKEADNG